MVWFVDRQGIRTTYDLDSGRLKQYPLWVEYQERFTRHKWPDKEASAYEADEDWEPWPNGPPAR
jgi:hypothetical protein